MGIVSLSPKSVQAQLLPFDLSSLLGDVESKVRTVTETLGPLTGSRSLSPATPLSSNLGLEVGASASLLSGDEDFWNLLGSPSAPLPVALLQIQKKLSPQATLGLHGLVFQDFKLYGGSLTAHLLQPEEGPFVSGRFTFGWARISSVFMSRNWGLEVLASRDLGYADPYLGVGAHLLSGTLTLDSGIPGIALSANALAQHLRLFGGVQLRLPALGLALTLEGEYGLRSLSGLSTKVSLQL